MCVCFLNALQLLIDGFSRRFRLGLILYVPVYLLFPELRGLIAVEGENGLVFLGMVVLSALRYLANACAYTAVMVLINVMTPAELVPLANGLAQSCISLARFIGTSPLDVVDSL